jgi:TolA-binding protein
MKGQVEEPTAGTPGDESLAAMIRLVRRTFPEGGPGDEPGLRRLQQRMGRSRRRRRLTFGGLGLLVAAAPLAIVLALRPAPLTFEVIHGAVGVAGVVRNTEPGTRIRFSDGTEIVLEGAARAQVRDVAAHGAGIVLVDGRAHTSFVPKPKARWQVLAGPYVVRVTGTIFDVAWSRDREQLDVWLRKGSVVVTGPMVEGGVAVTHDQHLSLRPSDRRIVLENGVAPPLAGSAPAAATESPPAPTPAPAPARDAAPARAAPSSGERLAPATRPADGSWQRRLASGDFDAVIAGAERRGLREVLDRGSRGDLAALADAARYTRRGGLARRALLAQRARFPGSTEAREAEYFLGLLAEDEGAWQDALQWYARYRREDPSGTYVAPALGRTLLLKARREGSPAARADAEEYLRRFPGGPYAPTARQIARAPAETSPVR